MILKPKPLTAAAFAPYGEVIEATGPHTVVNAGYARRYGERAEVDTASASGRTGIQLFVVEPWPRPIALVRLERHPLGSQAFIPLSTTPFLVAVAPSGDRPHGEQVALFLTNGVQGVNYRRGVWHHPALALEAMTFAVIDRVGPGANCEECAIAALQVVLP